MRLTHPDIYRTSSEKTLAIAQSTLINHAFGILKDPIKRAETLLTLLDIDTTTTSLPLHVIEDIIVVQEKNDKKSAQKMFDDAKTSFAKAIQNKHVETLKDNFLIMKYLARFLQLT